MFWGIYCRFIQKVKAKHTHEKSSTKELSTAAGASFYVCCFVHHIRVYKTKWRCFINAVLAISSSNSSLTSRPRQPRAESPKEATDIIMCFGSFKCCASCSYKLVLYSCTRESHSIYMGTFIIANFNGHFRKSKLSEGFTGFHFAIKCYD